MEANKTVTLIVETYFAPESIETPRTRRLMEFNSEDDAKKFIFLVSGDDYDSSTSLADLCHKWNANVDMVKEFADDEFVKYYIPSGQTEGEANEYNFVVRGGLNVDKRNKCIRAFDGAVIGFLLPDGRKARPAFVLEVESADGTTFEDYDENAAKELGFTDTEYERTYFLPALFDNEDANV